MLQVNCRPFHAFFHGWILSKWDPVHVQDVTILGDDLMCLRWISHFGNHQGLLMFEWKVRQATTVLEQVCESSYSVVIGPILLPGPSLYLLQLCYIELHLRVLRQLLLNYSLQCRLHCRGQPQWWFVCTHGWCWGNRQGCSNKYLKFYLHVDCCSTQMELWTETKS